MLRVFVITNDEILGGALVAAISGDPDVITCEIVDVNDVASTVRGHAVDSHVVILHGGLVESGNVSRLAGIAPVLVLGSGGADEMVEAVESGAMGYLDVDTPFEQVVEVVRSLAEGTATVDPSLLGALLRHVVERRRAERNARSALEVLTPRENEVFHLLAQGLDSQQLAGRLFISAQTVRTHTTHIMTKLDIHTRSELVALAARSGIDLEAETEEAP